MLLLAAAIIGAVLGALAGRLADVLPRRYGITHLAAEAVRRRRNIALVVLTAAVAAGIAHLLGEADLAPWHRGVLFAVNALLACAVLTGAAIDLEHMILPDEITYGAAALGLLSSPLRGVGIQGAIVGAIGALALTYLPFLLYKRLRGSSGMGLGDAKLAVTAGAWHGLEGAVFVLFAGALQSIVAAVVMRAGGVTYAMPESVRAELAELRARADAGDEEAKSALADDPMAAQEREGTLGMRLPLGPFLALASIEALFLRRWLVTHVVAWFLE